MTRAERAAAWDTRVKALLDEVDAECGPPISPCAHCDHPWHAGRCPCGCERYKPGRIAHGAPTIVVTEP